VRFLCSTRPLGEYTPCPEGGRRDLRSVLRIAGGALSAGGSKTIRAFIEDRVKAGKKPATVKRYVATIARVHIAAGLLNPCSSEAVRLGLKKMGRETSARQDQAHPLGWKEIKEFIDGAGESLRADRERAMLCVAYETLARRGEFVALEVRDIDFHPNGTGQALIRRGKTDVEGQGRVAYLLRETVKWLKVWLEHSRITERPVFRRLIGKAQIGGPLNPGSIAPIFKRVAQWIGITGNYKRLSDVVYWTRRLWRKWLSRRSWKSTVTWSKFLRLAERYPLPKARIVHRYI